MKRLALAAALLLITSAASAETIRDDRYFVAWGGSGARDVIRAVRCPAPIGCRRAHRPHRRYHRAVAQKRSLVRGLVDEVRRALPRGRGLAGIVPTLAAKASEIIGACHSRVISGVRHTYVAGTRRISLHAYGRAVDITGNPGCIYAHLRRWPGGYSIDYARVRHVHISYEPRGREWGARFVHGGHRRSRAMMARRHHYRLWHRRRA